MRRLSFFFLATAAVGDAASPNTVKTVLLGSKASAPAAPSESRVEWSLTVHHAAPLHASPVIGQDNRLYYSTIEPDCTLYCANATDGTVLWQYQPPQRDTADPANSRCGVRTTSRLGSGDALLHGANDNNTFFALDAETGEQKWTYMAPFAQCPDGGHLRPCEIYSLALLAPLGAAGEVRVQGGEDGHVRAFNAATGELLWDKNIAGKSPSGVLLPANGSPVLNPSNHSQFIIGADDGHLHCLELETGESCGSAETCGSTDTVPSVDTKNGILYYTCYHTDPNNSTAHLQGAVAAINTKDMSQLWTRNESTGVPLYVEQENAVFVGYDNGTVASLEPKTGAPVWVNNGIATGKEFFGSCVYDGSRSRIYCASLAKQVVALDTSDGELRWSQSTDGIVAEVIGPAISADGQHLYVGDYVGNLVSLRLSD